jgi:hypothetical protein
MFVSYSYTIAKKAPMPLPLERITVAWHPFGLSFVPEAYR